MKTEQATQIIAEDLTYGCVRTEALQRLKRKAKCMLTEDQYIDWVQRGKKQQKYATKAQKYDNAVSAIDTYARRWHWTDVSKCIEVCYAFLGADHPVMGGGDRSTGYAYHCGKHPIQGARAALESGDITPIEKSKTMNTKTEMMVKLTDEGRRLFDLMQQNLSAVSGMTDAELDASPDALDTLLGHAPRDPEQRRAEARSTQDELDRQGREQFAVEYAAAAIEEVREAAE